MTPKKHIIPLLFNYCLFLSHVFDATHTLLLEDIGKVKTNFWSAKRSLEPQNVGNFPDPDRTGLSKSLGRFLELLRMGPLQLYMWLKELITRYENCHHAHLLVPACSHSLPSTDENTLVRRQPGHWWERPSSQWAELLLVSFSSLETNDRFACYFWGGSFLLEKRSDEQLKRKN